MTAPRDLDAASKKLWQLVVRELEARGVLRDVDAPSIERYVRAEEVARQALTRIRKREKTEGEEAWRIRVTHGGWGVHPDARIFRESTRDAATYAHDLGLTPRARASMRQEEPTGPDPFADFLGAPA
ncbi:MAG TPA: P27 family phage terminase small subunit [Solirubrobacteraceae bacterium]|jgi:P27 family predicted phage terminase small subunit|nr:P27 family phage terminase small subunit [Solirubrobacteraceae bacterium]